jgi:hypothetical protein
MSAIEQIAKRVVLSAPVVTPADQEATIALVVPIEKALAKIVKALGGTFAVYPENVRTKKFVYIVEITADRVLSKDFYSQGENSIREALKLPNKGKEPYTEFNSPVSSRQPGKVLYRGRIVMNNQGVK